MPSERVHARPLCRAARHGAARRAGGRSYVLARTTSSCPTSIECGAGTALNVVAGASVGAELWNEVQAALAGLRKP